MTTVIYYTKQFITTHPQLKYEHIYLIYIFDIYIFDMIKSVSMSCFLVTLLRKSNQQPSHPSPLELHINSASIGNQWETGKT